MIDDNEPLKGKKSLDDLIDYALDSYIPRESRPGLEQRVLASVAVEAAAGGSRTWSWKPAWAFAAAVVLVAVIAIPLAHKATRPTIAALHSPQSAVVREPSAAPPVHMSIKQHPSASPLPAATRFAVPATPAKSRAEVIAPIIITPIRSQPLTDEALGLRPITIAPVQITALN